MTKRAGRSREGAWIEMPALIIAPVSASVAPARERGLKYDYGGSVSDLTRSLPRGSVD